MANTPISVQDQVTKLLEAYQAGRISEEVYRKNLDRLIGAVVEDSAKTAVITPPESQGPTSVPADPVQMNKFERIPPEPHPQKKAQPAAKPHASHPQSQKPAPRQAGPVVGTPSTALPACRKCGSTNLHICTDGSGTCNSCGRAFLNLTGKRERIRKEEPQPKHLPQYPEQQQYAQPYPPPYPQPYQQPPPQYYNQQPYPPPQYQPPQQTAPQYQPPKQYVPYRVALGAGGVSPECGRCGSNNLYICSDGSGKCNYCGKAFLNISESAPPRASAAGP